MTGTSRRNNCRETINGVIMAERPRMNNMLKILLPTTLPRAMSEPAPPENAAMTLTAISGELVPKATTVKPTTRGVIPAVTAILDAPRTRISAPPVNKIKPIINNMIEVVLMGNSLMNELTIIRAGNMVPCFYGIQHAGNFQER